MSSFDQVVRGGTVVDGTGMASFRADVGIRDGRIARIGRIRERGTREIDADGHIVTPGFIDGHTHMDAQLHWDPLGTPSSWNGVTTAVMGNCGFTIAPASAAKAALVIRNLERAEDISPSAMKAGITWSWETFPEYMQAVDRLPKGINYASYVGHSALRTYVMGERAFEQSASPDDMRRMQEQIRAAMQAGALGLSTSRSMHHETSDDRPVASRLAAWDEVRQLVGTVAETGGLFEIAHEEAIRSADAAVRGEYQDRLIDLAVATGVTITAGILPNAHSREAWEEHLHLFDRIAERGGHMVGQSHSRGVTILTSFLTVLPFDKLAEWKEVRSRPLDEQKRLLRDLRVRQRLVHAAHHGDYGRAIGAEARKPDFGMLYPMFDPLKQNPSVAQLAAERGVDPVELLIDLALERDFKLFFIQPVFGDTDPADLLKVMRHPRCVMTFSDSGAHVSQIADSSIHAHLLAYWAREQGAFTLEDAVRMITLAPARAFGFHDRGALREGMVADLNVLDYARFQPELPQLVHDLPSGARRLAQRCAGIKATLVAGEALFIDGEHTGALPGRLLRGPVAAAKL